MEKTFKSTINCRWFIVYSVRLIMNHDTNSTGAHILIRTNGIADPQRSKNEGNCKKKMEMSIFPIKFIWIKWYYVNHLMKLFHPSNISCIRHTNYDVESKNHSNWWANDWCKCPVIIFLKPNYNLLASVLPMFGVWVWTVPQWLASKMVSFFCWSMINFINERVYIFDECLFGKKL